MKRVVLLTMSAFLLLACSDNRTPEDILLDEYESVMEDVMQLMLRDTVCSSELDAQMRESESRLAAVSAEHGFDMFEPDLNADQRARFVKIRQRMLQSAATAEAEVTVDSSC